MYRPPNITKVPNPTIIPFINSHLSEFHIIFSPLIGVELPPDVTQLSLAASAADRQTLYNYTSDWSTTLCQPDCLLQLGPDTQTLFYQTQLLSHVRNPALEITKKFLNNIQQLSFISNNV